VTSLDSIGVTGYGLGYSLSSYPSGYWRPAGFFAGRNGVMGYTRTSVGVAVLGLGLHTNSRAAAFNSSGHGVTISVAGGNWGLVVTGGSKSAVVETDSARRQLYCEESSEVWFTDYGFGQLEDGIAIVPIDPVFAQTVNLDEPYHVFIQTYANADVYVADRTREAFEVSLRDGDQKAEFSYRLVAKRKGFEEDRLALFPDVGIFQQADSEGD
jgi:hypothetical protein